MQEKKLYIETYGCQMNVADSEVVAAVMGERGYTMTDHYTEADTILINTCSIRDNAEQRIWGRLDLFKSIKKKRPGLMVGLIGCMAERLGDELVGKKSVDLIAGPDAYRDLPFLLDKARLGEKAINTELTVNETYDSIIPKRIGSQHISGFVSITRGCNNFCTYCIVPYTRGEEVSRRFEDVLDEVAGLLAIERLQSAPRFTVWPTPDSSQTYTFVYWRMRRIDDAGSGINTMDVPFRFIPCMVAGLAYYLALKVPNGAQRIDMLKAQYDEAWQLASDDDREKASIRLVPRQMFIN